MANVILKDRLCSLCGRKFDVRLRKGNKIPESYWYGGKIRIPSGHGKWRKSKRKTNTLITNFGMPNEIREKVHGMVWTGSHKYIEDWECNYCVVSWDEETKTIEFLIKESQVFLRAKDLRKIIPKSVISDTRLKKLIWAMKGRRDIMEDPDDGVLIWIKADTPEAKQTLADSTAF